MDKRSYKTKQALAESLMSLMEKQKFEKISIESICAGAEVNRRNFYRHFLDKYDLLQWIMQEDFRFDFDQHPDWTIVDYFPIFCRRLYEKKNFYQKAYQITGQNGFRETCFNWLYPLLQRSTKEYSKTPAQEEKWLRSVTYMNFDTFVEWLSMDPCPDPDTFARSCLEEFRQFSLGMFHTYDRPYPEESVAILEQELVETTQE